MGNIGSSIASNLTKYLVDPALREGQYLFCGGEITRNLEIRKEDLKLRQESVQKVIEEALRRTDEIDVAVSRWNNDVKQIIAEVVNLQQGLDANEGCFGGWCPTWKRYRLCKQLAEKTEKMLHLNTNSKFDPFAHRVPLPDIEYFSSGNFMYFNSTKMAANKLLEALRDDSYYMIGLYGMGGSGKTSLAKEVGKKAKELEIFDRVVFTTVSQTPNVSNIQHEIADILGLKFEEGSESGRASRLSQRLKKEERILIVLDDVWKKLDFKKIGLPDETESKGCKFLLTTRLEGVCAQMDCSANARIPLSLLSEEESWSLFKIHAGINDVSSCKSMDEVARGVVGECKGLPIAIVAVGSSLKEKSEDEWKEALNSLTHPELVDVEPGMEDAFKCLKLSYDYLKNEAAQSIFLMCSMFPEDHEIFIEDLFRYGIGLGTCGQAVPFERARTKVKAAVRNLVKSCLLTDSQKRSNHLKMHDVVRDFGLWTASKEKGIIMANQTKNLNELAEDEAVKYYYALSSWDKKIDWLPRRFNAPKLQILLLNQLPYYENQLDLQHESFEGVKDLKVMAIINSGSGYQALPVLLPQTTQWLNRLRTLRLVGLVLDDISFVVSLGTLEILDLSDSQFNELPNGIVELKKLKLLDLTRCRVKKCCDDVIGRCSRLEELYIWGEPISINPYQCIEENDNFMNLQSYVLHVGQPGRIWTPFDLPTRVLSLKDLDISTSGEFIKNLLRRALVVELKCLKGGCRSIIPEMVQTVGGMNELTKLYLEDCKEVECLINNTPAHALEELCRGPPLLRFFQKLEKFSIKRCDNLQSVFSADFNLCNLKYLEIEECPKLTSLFSMSTARSLQKLEEISLSGCGLLEHVIRNGDGGANTGQEIRPVLDNSRLAFPSLEKIKLQGLPALVDVCQGIKLHAVQLTSIVVEECPKFALVLEYFQMALEGNDGQSVEKQLNVNEDQQISMISTAESLVLKNLSELMFVWKGPTLLSFKSLRYLRVEGCRKLKSIFSAAVIRSLPQLQLLYVRHCEELEEIISDEEKKERQSLNPSSSHPSQKVFFPKLATLEVSGCSKLKCIFPVSMAGDLPLLERLEITYCEELEEIISDEEKKERQSLNPSSSHPSQKVCFPKLNYLVVRGCSKLKCILPVSMAGDLPLLRSLFIEDCSKLEQVFRSVGEAHDAEAIELVLQKLERLTLGELPSLIDICAGFQPQLQIRALKNSEAEDCPNLSSSAMTAVQDFLPGSQDVVNGRRLSDDVPVLQLSILGLQHLQELEVSGCGKLKYVFSMDVLRKGLPVLSSLYISDLEELQEIIVPNEEPQNISNVEPSFPNLKDLQVHRCNKLKRLFSSTEVRMLPQLSSLEISEAEQLEEIFTHKTADAEEKIVLPNLSQIILEKLPVLVDVCQGMKLHAVLLTDITIDECPKFAPVSEYFQMALEGKDDQSVEKQLNVKEHEQISVISIAESLELKNLSKLMFVWKGPTLISFKSLRYLRVEGCRKLKSIFPTAVIRSLPQLAYLHIVDCEELEEIISDEEEKERQSLNPSSSHPSQKVCFPKLEVLEVRGCSKLKCIFPVSMAGDLPLLGTLSIEDCSKLEQVFGSVGEARDAEAIELVLPKLKGLRLRELPSLIDICAGFQSQLQFQALKYCKVEDCPNLSSTAMTALRNYLPEPQDEDDGDNN